VMEAKYKVNDNCGLKKYGPAISLQAALPE
jgi:hypothetical protein